MGQRIIVDDIGGDHAPVRHLIQDLGEIFQVLLPDGLWAGASGKTEQYRRHAAVHGVLAAAGRHEHQEQREWQDPPVHCGSRRPAFLWTSSLDSSPPDQGLPGNTSPGPGWSWAT